MLMNARNDDDKPMHDKQLRDELVTLFVAGYQTISAQDHLEAYKPLDSDVIVCGNNKTAKEMVMGLAEKISGVRAINGGGLTNAEFVENLTPLLLNLNRLYKTRSAIRITGI